MPSDKYTLKQLSGITGLHKEVLRRRATKEAWLFEIETGNGGKQHLFTLQDLPDDIRSAVIRHEAALAAAKIGPIDSPQAAGHAAAMSYLADLEQSRENRRLVMEEGLKKFAQLPEVRKREAEACYEVLKAAEAFVKAGGFKISKGLTLFCEQYNAGKIALPDWVIDSAEHGKPQFARQTYYRWKADYEREGLYGLASRYGHNAGRTKLTEEQINFIKAMLFATPDANIPKIWAGLQARFAPQGVDVPAAHVVSYWVKRWRKEKESLMLSIKNPDAWKQRFQFAAGNSSHNVFRMNQVWEADATPADIMLLEGRHTAIGMIDVWTRRAKVLITPTSKAQAIATLVRRCLIDWGVPEVLRTDNGHDFTARHMERVLDALEIEQELCPPFTPEAKPHVERFFRTFSHGIIELLPGYIGHNVAERKAIEGRKSFASRIFKCGEIIDVKLTAREFQEICDRWIDAVYHQDAHNGLDGKTPEEMVRESTDQVKKIADERALDVLLCPAPKDGGLRTVGKKGIKVDRRCYFNTAMAGYEGKRMRVLVDYTDLGKAYCFEEHGAFVCVATCPDWYGISAEDTAGALKRKQKAILAEERKAMRALAKEARIELVPEEVLSYRESLIANLQDEPREVTPYMTPAIEEAIAAADKRDGIINKDALAGPLPIPPEVSAYEKEREKVVSLQERRRANLMFESDWEVYTWILDRIKAGEATSVQKQWKRDFEDWQDGGMRRPFRSAISIAELTGQVEENVEGL